MEKVKYNLEKAPIDVVIPCIAKDLETVNLCIQGLRENVENIGRVFVVSSLPITDQAEWFDEKKFPFTKAELYYEVFKDIEEAHGFSIWYDRLFFNQILKLYAPLVIPGLSQNVLLIDADTIFLNPVQFVDESGGGLYNAPGGCPTLSHFEHMGRLLPGLKAIKPDFSGIVFHLLFQKPILEDLFHLIESHHKVPVWKAICRTVDKSLMKGCAIADYEIYFHFAFSRTDQVKIRPLKWHNMIDDLALLPKLKQMGYHHVSSHDWARMKRQIIEVARRNN